MVSDKVTVDQCVDQNDPIDVVDRQLWRDAQDMLVRHVRCESEELCQYCGRSWPCTSRRVGERAEVAAFMPWNEAWTVRNDLRSLRGVPGLPGRNVLPPRSLDRNRGLFT
jgi:hypothetical protein